MKNIIRQLDKAFDSKIRLGVMSIMAVNDRVPFNDLKNTLELTDGNLASHLRQLENLAYVRVHKSFAGRKPVTTYEITNLGREAFLSHLKALEEIIRLQ